MISSHHHTPQLYIDKTVNKISLPYGIGSLSWVMVCHLLVFGNSELLKPVIIHHWPFLWLDLNLVITVPADALAPNGARASAGIVMITVCVQVSLVIMISNFLSVAWWSNSTWLMRSQDIWHHSKYCFLWKIYILIHNLCENCGCHSKGHNKTYSAYHCFHDLTLNNG